MRSLSLINNSLSGVAHTYNPTECFSKLQRLASNWECRKGNWWARGRGDTSSIYLCQELPVHRAAPGSTYRTSANQGQKRKFGGQLNLGGNVIKETRGRGRVLGVSMLPETLSSNLWNELKCSFNIYSDFHMQSTLLVTCEHRSPRWHKPFLRKQNYSAVCHVTRDCWSSLP